MTATLAHRGERTSAPTFGRLLATELRRLAARRFARVIVGVCVLGYLVAAIVLWQTHSVETPADVAQATAQRDTQIAQISDSVATCLKAPGGSAQQCGSAPTAAEFPVDQFLANDPFLPSQVNVYTFAVGAAVALAGFALGATFIGAEWSSKNVVAWLFYEPRRLRLMSAKLLALLSTTLALSVLAQLIWAFTARLLIAHRGVPVSTLGADAGHFWSDVFDVQVRGALLVVPAALLGFGIANLIRNTAAAFGAAFVYFAIVESALRSISPATQPYLFTTGLQAWVSGGGIDVYGAPVYNQQQGSVELAVTHVSNLHGGLLLLAYAAVLLAISLLLFRRRDIS
ncbi:MAG: hypothetical protein ACR2P2_11550 [Nakamurella sp.]